jgi:Cu(I)/Ag(I) efflux system periplasmic protein CusF
MKIATLVLAVLLSASGAPSMAQDAAADHSAHHTCATTEAADICDGVVRKVDTEQNRLTLKHGEIKNLDMPDMIMVFRVTDPRMLDALKPGDKIKFKAEKIDGVYTVTFIEMAK